LSADGRLNQTGRSGTPHKQSEGQRSQGEKAPGSGPVNTLSVKLAGAVEPADEAARRHDVFALLAQYELIEFALQAAAQLLGSRARNLPRTEGARKNPAGPAGVVPTVHAVEGGLHRRRAGTVGSDSCPPRLAAALLGFPAVEFLHEVNITLILTSNQRRAQRSIPTGNGLWHSGRKPLADYEAPLG